MPLISVGGVVNTMASSGRFALARNAERVECVPGVIDGMVNVEVLFVPLAAVKLRKDVWLPPSVMLPAEPLPAVLFPAVMPL